MFLLLTPVQASTTQLEYRLRRLETDVSRLSSQVNRLQSQRLGRDLTESPPCTEETKINSRILSGDPMFDRLATLVIEIKQDVIEIQERLAQLESSN
ncbi:MAG: hypothetical protein QNJ68_06865 [Microcoleaceae cyanobacterium MO_207.B10]|nr:hypothetical protein [Microcoleaceae cyanobacterium MO_207.B10]